MSILSAVSEKTQGMEVGLELQDRTRNLCWPHMNGTTHHSLPSGAPASSQPATTSAAQNPSQTASTAHHSLPSIASAYHNLPPVASTYHNEPPITSTYYNQTPVTSAYHSLPPVAATHHNLPPVAATHNNSLPSVATAHHSLPPIAAITSCRPSSVTLKTPTASLSNSFKDAFSHPPTTLIPSSPSPKPPPHAPSSPSPRDKKEEHIFTQPNPPRLLQPVTRAPTPFPDHRSSSPQGYHNPGPSPMRLEPRPPRINDHASPTPGTVPFSIPSASAFAKVHRVNDGASTLNLEPVSSNQSQPNSAPSEPRTSCSAPISSAPSQGVTLPQTVPSPTLPPPRTTTPTVSHVSLSSTVNSHVDSGFAKQVPSLPIASSPVSVSLANTETRASPQITRSSDGIECSQSSSTTSKEVDDVPSEQKDLSGLQLNKIEADSERIKTPSSIDSYQSAPSANRNQHHPSSIEHNTPASKTDCLPTHPSHYPAISAHNTTNEKLPAQHSPSISDGLKNYSNQSHRYFATPATDHMADLSQSSQRNQTAITVATEPNRTSIPTSIPQNKNPHLDNVRYLAGRSESKIPTQVPISPNDSYRRFLPPSGRGPPSSGSGDVPQSFSPHSERFSPRTPAGTPDQYRNFSPHANLASPHTSMNQPERIASHAYPVGSNFPASSDSPGVHPDRIAPYQNHSSRPPESPRLTHTQSDSRHHPSMPAVSVPSRESYPMATVNTQNRNYLPQQDRNMNIYSRSAPNNESLRGYPTSGDRGSSALSPRAPQHQSIHPSHSASGYVVHQANPSQPSRPVQSPLTSYSHQIPPTVTSSRSFPPQSPNLNVSSKELARHFQQQNIPRDRGVMHYPADSRNVTLPGQKPVYSSSSVPPSLPKSLQPERGKYQTASPHTYHPPSSTSHVTLTPVPSKRPEQANYPPQDSFHPYNRPMPSQHLPSGATAVSQYPQASRQPQTGQYFRADNKQPWTTPPGNSRHQETINHFMPKTHIPEQEQMHRSAISLPQPYHSSASSVTTSSRDRLQSFTSSSGSANLPRMSAPPVVSVASQHSPRFSPHHSQSNAPFYGNARLPQTHPSDNSQIPSSFPFGNSRQPSPAVSLPYSPSLPRVNFPSSSIASFSVSTSLQQSPKSHVASRGSEPQTALVSSQQHHPRPSPVRDSSKQQHLSSQSRLHNYPMSQPHHYPSHPGQLPESFERTNRPLGAEENAFKLNNSFYAPTRSHNVETDTCRNPFELPAPTNHARTPNNSGVIKSHHTMPPGGYGPKPHEPKETTPTGYPPRPQFDGYPPNTFHHRNDNAIPIEKEQMRYPIPSTRTEQRSASGSDDRQKPQLSARFPPVPQSNYDLQRQIYDRMTGLQQAPPRLIEKARAEERAQPQIKTEPPSRQKKESPLDLSVKTVRQSADSTRDDVDLYLAKHFNPEPRLASAPKIDFNPNFAGPLVQPETRNVVSLPPVQSIRKFQAGSPIDVNPGQHRKRPHNEQEAVIPPKVPKVDAWKLAMDEQIEERLKAARQSRPPSMGPMQNQTLSHSEMLHAQNKLPIEHHIVKQERSHHGIHPERSGSRGWSSGVFKPPTAGEPDHERIVQQISQGVMPDSRLLQDRNVVDILRSSLEEKEARLQALQAAARRRQPLPSFNALPVERMCVPPSYQHGNTRGAEPVPIGVEQTRNYLQGAAPDADLDGLAAFLAARIRTKAEMKQMGPSANNIRPPDSHGGNANPSVVSPPKLMRENRVLQGQQQRRLIMSPSSEEVAAPQPIVSRDPAGLRSSSETSVFDFRESDSESEMPVLERQTLDGMRRPRKTQPHPEPTSSEPQPGPAPKEMLPSEPDLAWDNACDMFVEQLQTRPIKRSVRKKKPNPKFFATELENPSFLKVKTEVKEEPAGGDSKEPLDGELEKPNISREIKRETEILDNSDSEMPPLPIVPKDESSSDDDLPGVTIVKDGRVKLVTKKQKVVPSDSEWGSSAVETSSAEESASSSSSGESDDDSEGSSAWKTKRKARSYADSDSDDEALITKRKGRRTRGRAGSEAESDSSNTKTRKPRRTRAVLASDSDDGEQSDVKLSGRRTRANPLSDSGEGSDSKLTGPRTRTRPGSEEKPRKKGNRIQTRQQAKSTHPPGRMRLRSKKRGGGKEKNEKNSAFRPGWEDDLIKFKQQLRMPDRLIHIAKPKKRQGPSSLPDLDKKDEKSSVKTGKKVKKERKENSEDVNQSKGSKGKISKKEKVSNESKSHDRPSSAPPLSLRGRMGMVTRGKGKMLKRGGLRASVSMRRSNKAVQNSKRHLNNGKKRLKLRRKFRSGFDYMRRKKKQGLRKEGEPAAPIVEVKKKEKIEVLDVSAEVKSWVVNKSAGETVLHRAARLGNAEAAFYCLQTMGLGPSPRDHAGYTPLHEACSRGHVGVASHLLKYGASVCESARGGVRPLHQAAENNHLELVRLLLAFGADPMLATYTGQTALSLATLEDVRRLLQLHLADVQGDHAPKWSFEGPSKIFDPNWTVNPLSEPPSPAGVPNDVEIEASSAMLPPLFRLQRSSKGDDVVESSDRWLLLVDILAYTKSPSADALMAKIPNTSRIELTSDEFREQAICCNILSTPRAPGRLVHLLRYDEAVRQVLQVEVLTVSLSQP